MGICLIIIDLIASIPNVVGKIYDNILPIIGSSFELQNIPEISKVGKSKDIDI